MAVYGIDIHHRDKPDWKALAKAGVQFAYIKLSEGCSWVDPKGVDNVKAAQDAGLLVGAYHYFLPDGMPVSQFRNFCGQVDKAGGFEGMLLPALDVEGDKDGKIGIIGPTSYVADAWTWLKSLEQVIGTKPVVYTYKAFAQNYIFSALCNYPLWASSFTKEGPGHPAKFTGWNDKWTFHQYTTTGDPNPLGISIQDQNVFNGSIDELKKLLIVTKTYTIKVIDHATGKMLETLEMVENGWHPEQGKIYVKGTK
jgi:lysozyme